jgi:DNA-binding beta-propeller fold protein YncE
MNQFCPPFSLLVLASTLTLTSVSLPAADVSYHLLKEIPIGTEGGWDYLSIDSVAHRLYVSHATEVVVIDTARDAIVGEIKDTPGVHGLAVAADLGRGFTSNGRENKAGIIDLKTLNTLSKVETGENPDAILYETVRHEVYTFNGRGKSATVFDGKTGKVLATIPLSGKPEFAVEDSRAGKIYDNIEDKNEVAVIDAKAHRVIATWPIAPGEGASGMSIDLKGHRLFLGCDKQMLMLDSTTGKVLDKIEIGDGVDANAFDPGTKLAFASCGDGTVTIAREAGGNKLALVQTLKTQKGARTMTLDPQTHKIYLSAAEYEPVPEKKAGSPRQRPKIKAGTFKILVYGM